MAIIINYWLSSICPLTRLQVAGNTVVHIRKDTSNKFEKEPAAHKGKKKKILPPAACVG